MFSNYSLVVLFDFNVPLNSPITWGTLTSYPPFSRGVRGDRNTVLKHTSFKTYPSRQLFAAQISVIYEF